MASVRERCAEAMSEVMEVDVDEISDESGPETLDMWDSMSHVQLVLKLEKEFQIKISPEEGIEHFTNFKNIVTYIEGKQA